MTSSLPVELARHDIEAVFAADSSVVESARFSDMDTLWRIKFWHDGKPAVEMLVDNGINVIYLQVLVQVPAKEFDRAMGVVTPYAVVGVTELAGNYYLRGTVFMDFSTAKAVCNLLRAVYLAYFDLVETEVESAPVEQPAAQQDTAVRGSQLSSPYQASAPAAPPRGPLLRRPELSKGANVVMSENGTAPPVLTVEVGWHVDATSARPPELDASAIVVGENDRVLSDAHFVFFNNPATPEGAVTLDADGHWNGGAGHADAAVGVRSAATDPELAGFGLGNSADSERR